MPTWSEAQNEAIQTVGKNVVVSASAGSGKTAVLTARMVKRITQDRIPVENLLAMTFTDAAASEMKNRLYAGLDEVRLTTKDEELRQYCVEQCALMGNALICTIHSFCLQVIKENYFVIGLSPNQINKIFNDDEMKIIKEKITERVLQEAYEEDKERFRRVATHFSDRIDDLDALTKTIDKIVKVAMGLPDAEALFMTILDKNKQVSRFEEMDSEILKWVFFEIQLEFNRVKKILDELVDCTQRKGCKEEVIASCQLKKRALAPMEEAISSQNYAEFIRTLRSAAILPIKNDKDEEVKALRKAANDSFQDWVKEYFDVDELLYDAKDNQEVVNFLVETSKKYILYLNEEKVRQEGLDFSDMEHLAYEILTHEEVREKYRNRFDEILVDEFQDTNEFQNAMIEMIGRGNNIFRVGDIKQSIYRFRGAKPQIMADLLKIKDEQHQAIILHHNYRSNKSVVEFNNALFDRMMNLPGLNNEFTSDDHAEIGMPSQDDQYHWPVEFSKIVVSPQDKSGKIKEASIKAVLLANKILEMKKTTEFTHWKDYCVLVRSHAIKDEIRFVFEDLHIPYTTTLKIGFYKSVSIRILTSYLQLLLDDSNNIACLSVLGSFYQYTDDDFARLKLLKGQLSYSAFVAENNEEYAKNRAQLLSITQKEGFVATLRAILQIHDFYWSSLDKQERANVDLFINKAVNAENAGSSLSQFVAQIEACKDEPSSTAISASRSDDVVQITTIHQSKGLQYPVVFFWSGSKTAMNDEMTGCMVDEKLGLGLYHLQMPYRYRRPTLQRKAIAIKNALEEYEENIRLYYVALTRAQKVAIMIDKVEVDRLFNPLSIETFLSNKGSTECILASTQTINAPFYKEEWLNDEWRSEYVHQADEKKKIELPRYKSYQVQSGYNFETPSSYEERELRPLTFKGMSSAQRGTDLHKAVEELPTPPWSQELLLQRFPHFSDSDRNGLMTLGKNALYITLNQQEVHKEYAFALKKEKTILRGFIDFLAVDENSFTLVDYKSDRNVTEEELIERYQNQLKAYEETLKEIYPNKSSKKMIYSFSLGKFIELK